jgi:hypothetical protein
MSRLFLISYTVLWLLVVSEAVLLLLIYRQVGLALLGGRARVGLGGLPVGAQAPPIEVAVGSHREAIRWTGGGGRHGWVVIFALPGCPMCLDISEGLSSFIQRRKSDFRILWLEREMRGILPLLPPHDDDWISATCDEGPFESFDVRAAPFVFVIGEDGKVLARDLVGDLKALEQLTEGALTRVGR